MMNLLLSQCKAEMLRTARNPFFIIFSVAMPVGFYFIFSHTVGQETEVGGTEWGAYYLMSMTIFSIVGAAVSTFGIRLVQESSQGWTKQMKLTPLPNWMYYASKLITQLILNIGVIIIMFMAGGLFNGVELTTSQWILSGLWIWIGVIPFLALGLLVGQFKSSDVASIFANILHMGLALLGGLWMPLEIMPDIVQKIGKWAPTHLYGTGAWDIISGQSIHLMNVLALAFYFAIFTIIALIISKKKEVQYS